MSYSAEVYDSDGSIQYTNLTLEYGGSTVVTDAQRTGTTPSWNDIYKPTSGNKWLNATFETVDDAGAVTTTSIDRYLEDNKPSVTINNPSGLYGTDQPKYNVSVSSQDSEPLETIDVTLKVAGSSFKTTSATEGSTLTGNVPSQSDGSHTFKAVVSESDTGSASKQSSFETDTSAPKINVTEPDSKTNSILDISLNFTISDPNLDTGSCVYSKDGGTNISITGCSNTTVDFNKIGNHTITVYGSDTVGNTGSDTNKFFADIRNEIKAKDKASGNLIDSFQATFTNGTDTAGGSTSDGRFEIYTSNLPRNDVNLTIDASGYKVRTIQLNNVDKNFSLSNTYQLERAAFRLDTFSEQSQKSLRFNFTAVNATTSFNKTNITSFQEEYRNFDTIGFPTGDVTLRVQDVKGEYRQRKYFASITDNSKINLDAYLLEKGQGIYTSIKVLNQQRESISGVDLTIQKSFNGDYKTVAQAKTSDAGSSTFYLDPDNTYKVIANDPKYVSFSGTFNPANYQVESLEIILGDTSNFNLTSKWGSISASLTPRKNAINPDTSFNWTVLDGEDSITSFGLEIYSKDNGSLLYSDSTAGSSTGGTITINASINNQTRKVKAVGYLVKDGKRLNYSRSYLVIQDFQIGEASLYYFIQKTEATTSDATQAFLAVFTTLFAALATGRQFGTKGGGITTLIVLAGFTAAQFLNPAIFLVTLVAVAGALMQR